MRIVRLLAAAIAAVGLSMSAGTGAAAAVSTTEVVPGHAAPGSPIVAAAHGVTPEPSPSLPPHGTVRLDRVTAALRRDPLLVDPDLADALDAVQRARIRTAIARTSDALGTPVYVIVIPNPSQSEAQGRDDVFLGWVRDRLGNGMYVFIDQYRYLDLLAHNVPRRLRYVPEGLSRPADRDAEFAEVTGRVERLLATAVTAPVAEPRPDEVYGSVDAFGEENRPRSKPREAELAAPFLTGLFVLGPLMGLVMFVVWRMTVALRDGRSRSRGQRSSVTAGATTTVVPGPIRPTPKWLRRTADRDLERLRVALGRQRDDGAGPGRTYALAAYDAACVLSNDIGPKVAKTDAQRLLDLVGVIVLAGLGARALDGDTDRPAPACFVNPLHGASTTRATPRLDGLPGKQRRFPLCDWCAGGGQQTKIAVLQIRGRKGTRPHYRIPGIWQDIGFGAVAGDPVARVLEHLDV